MPGRTMVIWIYGGVGCTSGTVTIFTEENPCNRAAEQEDDRMERGKRWLIVAVYTLGSIITGVLALIYVARIDIVLFPDAMLPMQLYEQASGWLAWGAVPMGIASGLLYRNIRTGEDGRKNWKALCAFIPALICVCFFAYWIVAWGTGILLWLGRRDL